MKTHLFLKKSLYGLGILSAILLFTRYIHQDKEIKKTEKPTDFIFAQRAYPYGKIKTDAVKKALQWKKEEQRDKSSNTISWEYTGPTNIGGRITDIEIPSNDANTYYIGAASGGIYKSTNAGTDWSPIFDEQDMLSIGDIEISKSDNNLIYVGTGEVNAGGGSLAYDGNGIYKSTDAGSTWENKGLEDVGGISKILINPQDNNIIYAGAMGPLFKKDVNRGVFRSSNGGNTWEKVLFVTDSTGVIDMAINPINPNKIYAATWERIRRPDYRSYGGATSRIYRSNDAGTTWEELTTGLPSNPNLKGRISIDISQSNPNILYASYTDKIGYLQGVYKTTDAGDSWTAVNMSDLENTSYHWWFGGLFIDPNNPQHVLHAGFYMAQSTNGGANWLTDYTPHVDQHAIAFNSQNPNEILLGNDGGLYKSTDNGNSYTKINNLPITQLYHIVIDEQNENKRYVGAQDNNTIRTITGSSNDWSPIYGGDGLQPLVDPSNTNTIYAMYQYGHLARSTNNAGSFTPILNGISNTEQKNWDTPVCFDPSDSNTLFYGAERVYMSSNQGNSWNAISPIPNKSTSKEAINYHTITSIDVSPNDSFNVYYGTDDGKVWVSDGNMYEWFDITDNLPNFWVTRVRISPFNTNHIYVTLSGYRYGEDSGHVFMMNLESKSNWIDISGNLPDVPVNDIEIDTYGNLFIATDIGVMASSDQGNHWIPFGDTMPSVVVTDLYFHNSSKHLYAATYGRGSYRIDLTENQLEVTGFTVEEKFKVYPNPAHDYIEINANKDESLEKYNLQLYDLNGKLLQLPKYRMTDDKIQLKVNTIPSGIYLLNITDGVKIETHKIIVEH